MLSLWTVEVQQVVLKDFTLKHVRCIIVGLGSGGASIQYVVHFSLSELGMGQCKKASSQVEGARPMYTGQLEA